MISGAACGGAESSAARARRVLPASSRAARGRQHHTAGVNSSASILSSSGLSNNQPTMDPTVNVANRPRGAIQWYEIRNRGNIVSGS